VLVSASRRKGTAWESAIVDHLRAEGWPHVERRALGGSKDRGDIAGIPGVVIEAKAAQRIELAAWMDELAAEVVNDTADLGVLWVKRKGRASAGDGYIVMRPAHLIALLNQVGY
jgi:hypothetical protein